jgi:hypothetical protein
MTMNVRMTDIFMNLCGRVIMQSERHISPTFVPQYRRSFAFMGRDRSETSPPNP